MDHIVSHVFRRGVASFGVAGEEPVKFDLPQWGAALLGLTIIVSAAMSLMIEYTYGQVVATLTMVESPSTVVLESIPSNDPDAPLDEKKEVEPELLVIKQQPITAKFRTTIQHLRARAGRLSRFRGICLFYLCALGTGQITELFIALHIPRGVSAILAALVVARFSLGWTHIVMTEPSDKYWFRRLPSFKLWTKVAIPTAVLALTKQVTIGLPVFFFNALHLDELNSDKISEMNRCQISLLVVRVLSLVGLGLFAAVAIVVPARVTLTRVQASLLSESEETIVPFDRSFGGKFVPADLGGSGVISMLEAWKTFDWNSRIRILKVHAKVIAMQAAVAISTGALLFAELQLMTGSQLLAIIASAHGQGKASGPTDA
ncbi:MAG: hypothetical protein M1818_007109 [Claussenomyces sp. TS43310]|nr:MAG: hypothetical protein M1818_007109 [Claussenomyces sp. TS43310]